MSSKKPVDRRQFVKSGFAAAAGVAAIGAVTGSACPVSASQLPEGDWWCIIREEPVTEFYSVYWWLNCRTGEQRSSLSFPNLPLGNCVNAPNNSSCVQALVIDTWPKIEIDGQTFSVEPECHARQGDEHLRSVAKAWLSKRHK
jgi:hypothetical protein